MSPWVYVFSKFTQEALVFEALFIFSLICGYAAFWILRKRRLGAIDENPVPVGLVKVYLNTLINEAETLRAQLFGLLSASGHSALLQGMPQRAALTAPPAGAGVSMDPALLGRLAELETKIADQSKTMDAVLAEKMRIEAELAKAKLGGGGGGDSELKARLQELEARLAEYSVIEDDLANLKRLQQENAQLKAMLAGAGGAAAVAAAAPAPAPSAAPAAEPPMAAASEPEPAPPAAEAAPVTDDALAALAAAAEPAPEAPLEAPAPPEPSPMAMMDATPEPAPAAEAAPAAEPAPAAAAEGGGGDQDLVAEFEKMLNS